jgi:miniconductance mechanosensitive channel
MTMLESIQEWLARFNLGAETSGLLTRLVIAVGVLLVCLAALKITRGILNNLLKRLAGRTRTHWDNYLVGRNVFSHLALLVPAFLFYASIPLIFGGFDQAEGAARSAVTIYIIAVGVLVLDALLNAFLDIYKTFRVSRDIPVTGFVQVLKLVLYFSGLLSIIAILLGKTPLYLFSGLGAMTAVLMLVFKDAILGFVAGVQLICNRMLKQGDWIEMTDYGADGDVIDITLTTVKVQNWDMSITTIPTYALITTSFKNWRGMQDADGRRIKRALHIDMRSIRFCSDGMLDRFSRMRLIAPYLEEKRLEIEAHNAGLGIEAKDAVNGRRLTNIGTFRAYVTAYLRQHAMINADMTLMVRQLAPTPQGLPLEIYAFCKDKAWVAYEGVQADIFDHLLAVLPAFDLRVHQAPTGDDVAALRPVIESSFHV